MAVTLMATLEALPLLIVDDRGRSFAVRWGLNLRECLAIGGQLVGGFDEHFTIEFLNHAQAIRPGLGERNGKPLGNGRTDWSTSLPSSETST